MLNILIFPDLPCSRYSPYHAPGPDILMVISKITALNSCPITIGIHLDPGEVFLKGD